MDLLACVFMMTYMLTYVYVDMHVNHLCVYICGGKLEIKK